MIRHPAAYLKIKPVSEAFLERLVRLPVSPSQSPSKSDQALVSAGDSDEARNADQGSRSPPWEPKILQSPVALELSPTLPSALPRGQYCDERLCRLQIDRWSCVPAANEFAAAVLSNYLENDHLVAGFFDADILRDDLDASYPHLCTPFFFSSLMFLACVNPSL